MMTTTTKVSRKLATGDEPEARFAIPDEEQFGNRDYLEAPDLQRVAEALLRLDEFVHVGMFPFDFLWKAKGGQRHGGDVLGRLVKVGGLTAAYSDATYVVWIAADHCRARELTAWQMEALLYHELCHATLNEKLAAATRGHDFEGFCAEVRRYGTWRAELAAARESFQLALPLADEDERATERAQDRPT